MRLNATDLIVALDYLKHCQRIMNIDNNVGYEDGTLNTIVEKVQNSFSQMDVDIKTKQEEEDI